MAPSRAIPWAEMMRAALQARQRAYAPYSRFPVGAAVWATGASGGRGRLFVGCNVENASYGATLCAERVAVGNAVAAGFPRLHGLVVAASGQGFTYPCGMCRQVLAELAPELPIRLIQPEGGMVETNLHDLFPHPFTSFSPLDHPLPRDAGPVPPGAGLPPSGRPGDG